MLSDAKNNAQKMNFGPDELWKMRPCYNCCCVEKSGSFIYAFNNRKRNEGNVAMCWAAVGSIFRLSSVGFNLHKIPDTFA